ncbi:STAS domain-containing protein [Aquibacillus sp. 3ASR75-11]|uniref:STAS domain-containing protein n=1 Tax=Terrihalobacillus insolitus TaxID=2950438 RepID=A0A9X4AKT8_9BACI|nr:STAS domain-containing protein [Terrihalobacillus insolitus]MDC3412133.1 STAS domain-containing protein [Terrihalobacillus insolitus]MDC3423174.1 STAS domain-containing protein [Terrihalobacillus insolitus]
MSSAEQPSKSYSWGPEKGSMKFEGQDVLIFWIESAMKSFLDTIEEVSGDDAANVVMETAGFRMGQIVSDFFKGDHSETVVHNLPAIYASAGWMEMEVVAVSEKEKTATIRFKNSWEYKINALQGKTTIGAFIPGHLAGTLTDLFDENVGYRIDKSQLQGDEYDEVSYFPSNKSPIENIHEYTRLQEQKQIQRLEAMVNERTKKLANMVKEISSPIIPVLEDIVVVPLLGKYDEVRANDMFYRTMQNLPAYQSNYLILDLTGLDEIIDEYTISLIHRFTSTTSLLGTKCIIVGISPQLGMKITDANFDLKGIDCFSTLKHAIHFALAQEGKQIIG